MTTVFDDPSDWVRLAEMVIAGITLLALPFAYESWRNASVAQRFSLNAMVAFLIYSMVANYENVLYDHPAGIRTFVGMVALIYSMTGVFLAIHETYQDFHWRSIMKSKPVLTTSTITAAASAVIYLLVSFGLDLTGDQQAAILGVVAIAAPAIIYFVASPKVTANSRVVEEVKDGEVLAGEANELPTGAPIRPEGSLHDEDELSSLEEAGE